jgi:hypothetical protein
MCETWELRPDDVDITACRAKGIPVLGTNEEYPGLDIFAYSGWLCLKMLFEAQIELHKSQILIVSSDKFGNVIHRQLLYCGASSRLTPSLHQIKDINEVEAVVVADYTRDDMIIGPEGDITAQDLSRLAPKATIIQFAGLIDLSGLLECGLTVYPTVEPAAHRMGMTLAALGPRPVVELHTAGLKVGELMWRERQIQKQPAAVEKYLSQTMPLCQAPIMNDKIPH